MENKLQILEFESKKFRRIIINGEYWFIGNDFAKALGYENPKNAILKYCKKSKLVSELNLKNSELDELVGRPNSSPLEKSNLLKSKVIPESDLYRLVGGSKLKSAEKFRDWVYEEVLPSIRKTGSYGTSNDFLPNHIQRYLLNIDNTPHNYFSVMNEMFIRIYGSLKKYGYEIPDRAVIGEKREIRPDVSFGKGFSTYLQTHKKELYDSREECKHFFPNGKYVMANMYHIDALPYFIKFIHEVWFPNNAEKYLGDRDPNALKYLPKLLEKLKKENLLN